MCSENDAYYRARFGGSQTVADVDMRELINAVLDWASTSQNHGGNPYLHEHVQRAERLAIKWGIKR